MPKPLHEELLDTAEFLAFFGQNEGDVRRSISTSYYALFHWLAKCCADMLVGSQASPSRAWLHVYRRLQHRRVATRCHRLQGNHQDFPPALQRFAKRFVELQKERERADYAPHVAFALSEARTCVELVRRAIVEAQNTPLKDLRAFAVWVLLPRPRE